MVFMVVVARLVREIKFAELRVAAVAMFCLWNVFYMWTVKDRQFLERAAPTTELLHVLQSRPAAPIRIEGFPYPVTEIAKDVAFLVPGWTRDMIDVNDGMCAGCATIQWDGKTYR
jgi:hypothetical protein